VFAEIEFDAVAHENGVGSFFEEFHEGPGDGEGDKSEEDGKEDGRLDLVAVGFDGGDEEVSDDCAEGDDEACADVDEELSCAMADEELTAASEDEVEGFLRRGAKIFAGDGDHDIGVLGDEANGAFETRDAAGDAADEAAHCLAVGHPHRLVLHLLLSQGKTTLMYSSTMRTAITMAISKEPKAMEPRW
jgi:hypothetical protein